MNYGWMSLTKVLNVVCSMEILLSLGETVLKYFWFILEIVYKIQQINSEKLKKQKVQTNRKLKQ
jgi:hypothetical protein